MIVHTHDSLGNELRQGSGEWYALRLGIPTCSAFGRIMTEKKMEYSTGAHAYIAELLAERWLGHSLELVSTGWTERGKALEDEARRWYALERGVEPKKVCFVTDGDPPTEGGSPDAMVGSDGIIEIKCYGAKHHMLCLLGLEPIASKLQVQGYLRLTGREWCDSVAYSAPSEISGKRLPPRVDRTYRDETYINALSSCLERFKEDKAKAWDRLQAIGPGGIVGDDGLLALLAASVRKELSGKGAPKPEELAEFHARVEAGVASGALDDKDQRQILADIEAGRWDAVKDMDTYLQRAEQT